MRKILSGVVTVLGTVLDVFVIFVLLYVGFAWLLPRIPVNAHAAGRGNQDISIYIKTNGVHTDIVVPVKQEQKDWSQVIRFEHTESNDSTMQYLAFGWGDKGFYLQTPTWADLKFSVAFKAMFHLGSSAVHCTFYKEMVTGAGCKSIKISKEEYGLLINYLLKSLKYDAEGRVIVIPSANDGYGRDDAFYESPGVYDLFHTCNTWANNGLKASRQKACFWTASASGIFYQYREQ